MFCTNCGTENGDDAKFCRKCGSSLGSSVVETSESPEEEVIETNENTNNTKRIVVICICVIIIVLGICTAFIESKEDCTLTITNEEFTEDNPLIIKLTDSKGNPIPNKTVKVSFSNSENSYVLVNTTDEKGVLTVTTPSDIGTYNVTCNFEGDDKYNYVSTTKSITIKKSEPNYESYDYSLSFEDTDTDGDGYVMLSDMNIAHTPEETQMQMFSDSDDNGDGKLNKHEYYKFMYKLNYDFHSYGL